MPGMTGQENSLACAIDSRQSLRSRINPFVYEILYIHQKSLERLDRSPYSIMSLNYFHVPL